MTLERSQLLGAIETGRGWGRILKRIAYLPIALRYLWDNCFDLIPVLYTQFIQIFQKYPSYLNNLVLMHGGLSVSIMSQAHLVTSCWPVIFTPMAQPPASWPCTGVGHTQGLPGHQHPLCIQVDPKLKFAQMLVRQLFTPNCNNLPWWWNNTP